jgi:hypothetical protein
VCLAWLQTLSTARTCGRRWNKWAKMQKDDSQTIS